MRKSGGEEEKVERGGGVDRRGWGKKREEERKEERATNKRSKFISRETRFVSATLMINFFLIRQASFQGLVLFV